MQIIKRVARQIVTLAPTNLPSRKSQNIINLREIDRGTPKDRDRETDIHTQKKNHHKY